MTKRYSFPRLDLSNLFDNIMKYHTRRCYCKLYKACMVVFRRKSVVFSGKYDFLDVFVIKE